MSAKNLDLMGIFYAREQEEKAANSAGKIDTKRKGVINAELRKEVMSGEAFAAVSKVLPNTDGKVRTVIASVLTSVFNRALEGVASFTPFNSTPEGAVTYPEYLLRMLKEGGAVIPTATGTTEPSYGALSNLSGITKSSMASTNAARQHLTVPALEKWRLALAAIGEANKGTDIYQLSHHGVPETYLTTLLSEWRDLDSPLPLGHIKEWALEYANVSQEKLDELVAKYTPTYTSYLKAMLKVWREQYQSGQIETYAGYGSFLEVLKTKTSARRLGRGFNDMVTAVHTPLDNYNSRVTYPKTNFKAYKDRYNSLNAETGLSAEVLMGYCLFTGINPISILQWVSVSESATPGTWTAERVYIPEDMIMWKGAISPRDCVQFFDSVQTLGLVSDQNLWALHLLHPTFTYKNIPTYELVSKVMNDRLYDSVVTEATNGMPSATALSDKVGYEHETLFGQAFAHVDVLQAASSEACISGTAAGLIKTSIKATPESIEASLTELINTPRNLAIVTMKEQLAKAVLRHTMKSPNAEKYAELVLDGDGAVAPESSYSATDRYKVAVPTAFYTEVLERTESTLEV